MLHDLHKCIEELLDCNAFELHKQICKNGQTDYYIPYMMNDALECYFVLKDCQMKGEYLAELAAETYAELVETSDFPALILRQGTDNVATLWFKDVHKKLKCYRYHEIGHFWVNGQEQWRQLVYIIGTIYDKYEYMGSSICNDAELALLPLMEFAPFRYWSPIHESLDEHYPNTLDGIQCMKKLCVETGDKKYLKLVVIFEKVFKFLGKNSFFCQIVKVLAKELGKAGHEKLYELIYKKVCAASCNYPARDYGEVVNTMVANKRQQVVDELIGKGFIGSYPKFQKNNVSVLVTEEQPFTLSALEYENYEFRIQFMVSETKESSKYLNQGFFEGTGNRGWIAKELDQIGSAAK